MKTPQLKQFFKATALALCISSAAPAFAQTVDQVVAVVDNSVILQSDLAQTAAEMQQQLQAQNKTVPPAQYLQQQALEQLIVRQAQLEQVKRYNIKPDEKALNEAVMRVAQQNGSKSLEDFQQKVDRIAPGTYASLRNRIAEDLAINRLRQQVVMSRIKISDQDVDNFLKTPQGQAALGSQAHVLHVRVSGENAQATAEQVKTALNNSNDLNAINKQFSTAATKVESADMGFRSLSEIPAELAARVSALDVGQTTELIAVNDGIHVLKLVDRKAGEQRALVPQYQTQKMPST